MTKNTPATTLPWHTRDIGIATPAPNEYVTVYDVRNDARGEKVGTIAGADAAYIAHAANAYPRLVEALHSALSAAKGDWQKGASWDHAATKLLRELGEL